MNNVIKDYHYTEALKEPLTTGELTDLLFKIWKYVPAEKKAEFDKDADSIINSYSFMNKRLARSEFERFNK